MELSRRSFIAEQIVVVDGLPGCGKTMLSPIVSALERVELPLYAYEIEHTCSAHYLGRLPMDVASTLIRLESDLKLYNTMMSRECNFRYQDLSSIFHYRPWRYIKRLFQPGDAMVMSKIKHERPILNFTTHHLLTMGEPMFMALGERLVLIEVVRHPLYMLKQQVLNMERLLGSARHFTIYQDYKGADVPFWTNGWEELFLRSNPVERSIYMMERLLSVIDHQTKIMREKYNATIIEICFEKFVTDPWNDLQGIAKALATEVTQYTRRVLAKQRVPRRRYAEGVALPIYKHSGWEPPITEYSSERDEFEKRRSFAVERASPEAMEVLDRICREYEQKYLGAVIIGEGGYR